MEYPGNVPGSLLGRGLTAEIFDWDPGKVLKLFLPGWDPMTRDYEVRVVGAAVASGVRAPRVDSTVEVGGRSGIVYERIPGLTLTEVLMGDPSALETRGRKMAEVHLSLHRPAAPGLPLWKDRFDQQIRRNAPLLGPRAPVVLEGLADLTDGRSVCHGDFHPGNILVEGDAWVALDWMNAYAGDPASDVVRAWLMLESPFLDPAVPGALRDEVLAAKRRLGAVYLEAYLGLSGFSLGDLAPWIPAVAAVRLGDRIPGETPWLLDLIDRGWNR